jgi:hypothetical protein
MTDPRGEAVRKELIEFLLATKATVERGPGAEYDARVLLLTVEDRCSAGAEYPHAEEWTFDVTEIDELIGLLSATPEVESAKIADLKRQLAAAHVTGRLLQAEVDAFKAWPDTPLPATARSGMAMLMATDRPRLSLMVERFLNWPLPGSVCSDQCATKQDYPNRIGTNLLTADEARQMLEYVLAPLSETAYSGTAKVPEEIQEWIWHLDLHLTEHDDRHARMALRAAWPKVRDYFLGKAPSPDGNEESK